MTSVNVQLDITVERPCEITAQTILKDKTTILGQKDFEGSGVMFVDVPQSDIASFGLVYDDGIGPKQYRRIDLTGENDQVVRVSFTSEAPLAAAPLMMAPGIKSQPVASLCGNSVLPDCGYLNFGPWAWEDISLALTEGDNPKKKHVSLIDYEIMARGQVSPLGTFEAQETVYLSMLYGYTGTKDSRVLGYYVHSKDDFSDIEFYDITETLTYDYINGKGKVQYQLDNNTSTWYDASFYFQDGNGLPAKSGNPKTPVWAGGDRDKDDIYNTYLASEAYGGRVSAVRGLTFELDIPKGKVFGFYLRTAKAIDESQKNLLKGLGVPDAKLPEYEANYTNARMNLRTDNFRSALAIYDNFTFMGLDDAVNGGDYDCNDVTFALSNVRGEKLQPQFTEETLKSPWNQGTIEKDPIYSNPPADPTEPSTGTGTEGGGSSTETGTENLQTWTLAYENGGTDIDFDFNDVVLQVTPNTNTHTATVYLMAAGAKRNTEIYYDNQNLGEIHQLFGVEEKEMVNTLNTNPDHDPVLLSANLSWPEGTTMSEGRHKFWLRVYNEDGTHVDIHSNVYLGPENDIPQALCVAGEWHWPLETERVYNVYPVLTEWARNINDKAAWNWYAQPDNNKTVKPKKPGKK
ncbi:MAG: DUF4842 domain-containing protein [Bacteroidales bacterium]|nr:DUF4842 domain-containing protein [Bacteroidales bacterium]